MQTQDFHWVDLKVDKRWVRNKSYASKRRYTQVYAGIRRYTQVYAGIPYMQESSGEKFDRRHKRPASDPPGEEEKQPRRKSGSQRSHDLKREKKGKDKKRGHKHNKRSRK